MTEQRIVYVVGAGLSAGLGFPTISSLLREIWPRLVEADTADDLARIIRFHHPDFNPALDETFVNVEMLLSEMQANEQLFSSTRAASGGFTSDELIERRQSFLLEIAAWFHDVQREALGKNLRWFSKLVDQMREENAQIISFNWDLVLDEMLFGDDLDQACYGLSRRRRRGVRLIKPHGSLNWYEHATGKYLSEEKKFKLHGTGADAVYAFKPYRAPSSSRRSYMPLIVPPVFNKEFGGSVFQSLWREAVSVLSTASEVRFLGYSLADADFHARFALRCGFYNQEHGEPDEDGTRQPATGRAQVTIVDPNEEVGKRIERAVGWRCSHEEKTIRQWMTATR